MPRSSNVRYIAALVVEDSAILVDRLMELLRSVERVHVIDVVDTEERARRAIRDSQFDLVLLDLRLREGNGFGVLREIEHRSQRPAVVVLSNYSLSEYRLAAEKHGARYFLDKAEEIETLPDVLAELRAEQARHPRVRRGSKG
jgi:two-component system chemotaxis response regulator CheY